MNDRSRSPYPRLAGRPLVGRVLAGIILLCAGVYCTGCGTVARTLQLPFKAAGAGVQAAEKMLSNPMKVIDKALDTSSRAAGGARWLGQNDAPDGVSIHSVPIAYETSVHPPYTARSESS